MGGLLAQGAKAGKCLPSPGSKSTLLRPPPTEAPPGGHRPEYAMPLLRRVLPYLATDLNFRDATPVQSALLLTLGKKKRSSYHTGGGCVTKRSVCVTEQRVENLQWCPI